MSVSLQEQISTLFSCLAMGLGVGLLYDLLRLVRLTLPRRTLQEILDLLFWLGACGMLFFCGIVFGNGRVRLYMALCLLLGATAYFLLLSPWTRRALDILARAAARFLGWVTAPLRWLIRVLTAPLAKILRKWKKTWKKFFSFSRLWSTIYHLIGKHGKSVAPERQETEAAPHVPIQKVGLLAKIILLILLAYMIFTLVSVRQKIADANAAVETLTQQVSDQTQTNTELSNAIENRDDPSYVEDIARENWVWWHPMTVCSILPIKGPALYLLIA